MFGGFGFASPASGLRLVAAGVYSAGIAGAGLKGYKIIQAQKHPCERRDMIRVGRDYYSLIARAVDALHINVRATRLMLYEQVRTAQRGSFDPEIPEAEFRRERTALEKAIRAIETKAAAADEEQAKSDRQIVSDYAGFIVEAPMRLDCFYDASELPYPKEAIIAAIERESFDPRLRNK